VLHNVTTASSNCCTFVVMLAMEEDVGSRHRQLIVRGGSTGLCDLCLDDGQV